MSKKKVLTTITIIWMIIIFIFSNQPASASSNSSNSLIKNTIVRVYKLFNSNASEEDVAKIVEKYNYPVRKTAHFLEYLILGVLVLFTMKAYNIKNIYIMLLICFLYACTDEFHQLFIEGRSGNIKDVLIDTLGSLTGILFFHKIKK